MLSAVDRLYAQLSRERQLKVTASYTEAMKALRNGDWETAEKAHDSIMAQMREQLREG